LTYQDKTLVCRDCSQEFTFTGQEQVLFKERGFNAPARCAECHKTRNARRDFSRKGDGTTYPAVCASCGKETELPFNPTQGKPAYCSECFRERLRMKTSEGRREFVLKKVAMPKEAETGVGRSASGVGEDNPSPQEESSETARSFADFKLDERLNHAIAEAKYEIPTPVQFATIPLGLEGRDIIGTAQTGTGKTAAFVLPILQHLLENPIERSSTRVLVLAPTRELAEQVSDVFKQLGRYTKIKTATVYGGVGMIPQENALRRGVEVIVACPGRLLDHIERGNTNFSEVRHLVLDEADRMLDMGFMPSIKRIISHLPKDRQNMLFSATFAPDLMKFTKDALNKPVRVDVDLHAPAKTVSHVLYPCPQHLKTSLLLKVLEETDANSVLIFTKTKHRANRVAQQIERAGFATSALHSNKSQSQRQTALDDFRSGRCQIMVATDIAARGLDVETISHVINYDIPDTADTYIHRIGRTGRAEREGDAMTLITQQDMGVVWDIEKTLGSPIERRKLDDFDYEAAPPNANEFKRAPLPKRKPKVEPTVRPRAERVIARSDSPARARTYSKERRMTAPAQESQSSDPSYYSALLRLHGIKKR
jgi:ATP-dependent RNA helicase RhlE